MTAPGLPLSTAGPRENVSVMIGRPAGLPIPVALIERSTAGFFAGRAALPAFSRHPPSIQPRIGTRSPSPWSCAASPAISKSGSPERDATGAGARATARFASQEGEDAATLRYDESRKEFVGSLEVPAGAAGPELELVFRVTAGSATIGEDRLAIRIVRLPREFVDVRANPELLRDIARATGGRVLRTKDDLAAVFGAREEERAAEREYRVPRWDRWWIWLAFVALLAAEWVVRRMARA